MKTDLYKYRKSLSKCQKEGDFIEVTLLCLRCYETSNGLQLTDWYHLDTV